MIVLKYCLLIFSSICAFYEAYYYKIIRPSKDGRLNTKKGKRYKWSAIIVFILGLVCQLAWFIPEPAKLIIRDRIESQSGDLIAKREIEFSFTTSQMAYDSLYQTYLKPHLDESVREISVNSCDDINRRLAMKYYEDQQWDSTIIIWKLVENNCKDIDALFYIGTSYIYLNEYSKAIAYLQNALELNPKDYSALINLATAYYHLKNYNQSLFLSLEASKLGLSVENLINIGLNYRKLGNLELSTKYFEKAYKLNSGSMQSLFWLSYNYFDLGYYDKAIIHFKQYAEYCSNNAEIYNALAGSYLYAGDTVNAVVNWKTAIQINPNSNNVKINLAQYSYYAGDLLLADSLYNELNIEELSNTEIAAYLAITFNKGDIEKLREITANRVMRRQDYALRFSIANILFSESKYDSVIMLYSSDTIILGEEDKILIAFSIYEKSGFKNAIDFAYNGLKSYSGEHRWKWLIGELYMTEFSKDSLDKYKDSVVKYWQMFESSLDSESLYQGYPHIPKILKELDN